MDAFKKYAPLIFSVLGLIVSAFAPAVADLWAKHPQASGIVASVVAILASLAPQPHK